MASSSLKIAVTAFALLAFGAFAVHGPFGASRIEAALAGAVREGLERDGATWARADVDGQSVILSGDAPTAEAVADALRAAQSIGRADRMLGPITSIDARKIVLPPPALAIADYHFVATYADGALIVEGMSPDKASLGAALAPLAGKSGVHLDDRTVETPLADMSLWTRSARLAFDALSLLASGEVRFERGTLRVSGVANSVADADAAQSILAGVGGVMPLVAEISASPSPVVSAKPTDEDARLCQAAINGALGGARLTFRADSANLSDRDLVLLDQLMAEMGACAGQTVFVDGHTDSRGSRASNLRLSERRARAVIEYLARASENPRFETRAFGESRPISSNRTAAGQRRNRRIEFVVVGAGPESE